MRDIMNILNKQYLRCGRIIDIYIYYLLYITHISPVVMQKPVQSQHKRYNTKIMRHFAHFDEIFHATSKT